MGPFLGRIYIVIVNSCSKWLKVYPSKSVTATNAIDKMTNTFAILGLPQMVISDNGPAFTSKEFENFVTRNGIHYITSPPYHTATNKLAELALWVFREEMSKKHSKTLSKTQDLWCLHILTDDGPVQ